MRYLITLAVISAMLLGCKVEQGEPLKISSARAESVFLTQDHLGNAVIGWTERTDNDLNFVFSSSPDAGNTFPGRTSVKLSSDVATHAEGMPKIAFKKNGTIVIGYERKAPTPRNKYAGAVCYITSENQGRSWSKEKYIHSDTTSGLSRSYFDIEPLADGEIGAAWLDTTMDTETKGRAVRFAKTNDENAFTNEVLIERSACQCCRIDVYGDENKNVYVAYRGLRKGTIGAAIRDMMVATSGDQGVSFSAPFTISSDNWNIDGCPHTGPSLCSNKTGLFTMWYTEGNGTGVYFAHKSETSDQFQPREIVSPIGHRPQVCSDGNVIAMVWEENTDNEDPPVTTVKYRLIEDGIEVKRGIISPKNVNSFLPVVTQTKGGFLAAYIAEVDGQTHVFVKKL